MPALTEGMNTGDTLQTLMGQVEKALIESKAARLNCDEIVAGNGVDALPCNSPTLDNCSGDCVMAICSKHTKVCKNCNGKFCQVCFQSHVC